MDVDGRLPTRVPTASACETEGGHPPLWRVKWVDGQRDFPDVDDAGAYYRLLRNTSPDDDQIGLCRVLNGVETPLLGAEV